MLVNLLEGISKTSLCSEAGPKFPEQSYSILQVVPSLNNEGNEKTTTNCNLSFILPAGRVDTRHSLLSILNYFPLNLITNFYQKPILRL